jgi:peptidoglycan/xylan/chitin deacetylase (PgdA/CDA1 family)
MVLAPSRLPRQPRRYRLSLSPLRRLFPQARSSKLSSRLRSRARPVTIGVAIAVLALSTGTAMPAPEPSSASPPVPGATGLSGVPLSRESRVDYSDNSAAAASSEGRLDGTQTDDGLASSQPIESTPGADRLSPSDQVYNALPGNGVGLTFDDGPDPAVTPRILAILKQRKMTATFCLIGQRVWQHPELVRELATAGMTLCNHTMRHDSNLRKRSRTDIATDLTETSRLIEWASGGVRPVYFRAPSGNWSPTIVSVAREQGMASLGWNVTSLDWKGPPQASPKSLVAQVHSRLAPGCIVLFHDRLVSGSANTVLALPIILTELEQRRLTSAHL